MSFDKEKESALNGGGYTPHLQQHFFNPTTQNNSGASSPSFHTMPMYNNGLYRLQQQQKTSTDSSNNVHVNRQLTYAQNSRQSSTPHHHARTAAAMARSTPASSTVTITDPNNPQRTFTRMDISSSNNSNDQQQSWATLDMGGMRLKNISPPLFTYTFLTSLYLNHNSLSTLPTDIAKLINLKVLDCSSNNLTAIPPELGMLVNLKELLFFDNTISALPNELGMLYQLEMLGLEGNPIQTDIKNLLMNEGTQALIVSLRENTPVGLPPPQREWVVVNSDNMENDPDKFTVLCYNILCQKYATSQAYGYTPSWALNWDYRKDLIVSEIFGYNADIACLQEIQWKEYDGALGDIFKERGDYDGVFFPKSRAKTMAETEKKEVDGCAIFYKASKFDLIEHNLLEYNQKAIQRPDFKQSDDIYNRVMVRDNIAVMAVLENKETLARVLVVNSHICWDPQYADVKLVQVGLMMDEIEKFAAKHLSPPSTSPNGPTYSSTKALPMVICGDFNSVPSSGVYEFLSKGSLAPDHSEFGKHSYGAYTTEGMSHKLSVKSSYSHIGELDITNYTPGFKGTLDYIWYANNVLDIVSLLGGLNAEYIKKMVGFPNAHYPSDHVPLLAEMKIKPLREPNEEPNFGFSSFKK